MYKLFEGTLLNFSAFLPLWLTWFWSSPMPYNLDLVIFPTQPSYLWMGYFLYEFLNVKSSFFTSFNVQFLKVLDMFTRHCCLIKICFIQLNAWIYLPQILISQMTISAVPVCVWAGYLKFHQCLMHFSHPYGRWDSSD